MVRRGIAAGSWRSSTIIRVRPGVNATTQEQDMLGIYQVLTLATAAQCPQELQAVDEGLSLHVALTDLKSLGFVPSLTKS